MKYLLTSGGIKNKSIYDALLRLLDKPIDQCKALCITTASYAIPNGLDYAWKFISGNEESHMCDLGWKSLGVLELTALCSIPATLWENKVKEADVLLVNGGDPLYLNHWMKESGVAKLLPSLSAVYVGLSAGSMILTPRIGASFVNWQEQGGDDRTLGIVDFSIFPHLNNKDLPDNTLETAKLWINEVQRPAYVIDDDTAIVVTDDTIEVVSEGEWVKLDVSDS